tara:strand:- start:77 stop:964 length:888 start_codon:yes stop_codon:yes gene_type:complete
MIVPNQKNIKVHLATTEIIPQGIAALAGGSQYNLGTAFPFVYDLFNKGKISNSSQGIINKMSSMSKHYILDSGLFTLMFGALKGNKDEKYIEKWAECLTQFVLSEGYKGTMVEVDCQKVLGVEKAWKYREKMSSDVSNRIINVFHIEDGQKGLDRLIEYSDYIAISVPELRFIGKKGYLNQLANYIKNRKPDIDIHLLGCTEKNKLKELNFCSSADSSSWISSVRYGQMETRAGKSHINNLKKSLINEQKLEWFKIQQNLFPTLKHPKNKEHLGILTFCASEHLKIYQQYAGSQD